VLQSIILFKIMNLTNKDKILDISVNLARVSDWIFSDTKQKRVDQFLGEISEYLQTISPNDLPLKFQSTFLKFQKEFQELLQDRNQKDIDEWAERALTWANILQHRSKLLN